MTTQFLLPDLERDEGYKGAAYPDPLTNGPPWTIGFGHTGREVHPGLYWTKSQAMVVLRQDVAHTRLGLDTALPWWRTLTDPRQDCLVNQAFNLGVHGLLEFETYLKLVHAGDYAAAAEDDIHTLWAKQVGDRAKRIANQMATNIHQV